jgi:hypothetical protein
VASGLTILVGIGARLMIGAGGIGDQSAAVMLAILGIVVWVASGMLASARTAFLLTLATVLLLDLAALPARGGPEYDDRQALFRTDQQLDVRLTAAGSGDQVLLALVEPVFGGAQPAFGMAAEINGRPLAWDCSFRHGIQQVALPLSSLPAGEFDVRLRLTGTPSREADYLLVYSSSVRNGPLLSITSPRSVPPDATPCTSR